MQGPRGATGAQGGSNGIIGNATNKIKQVGENIASKLGIEFPQNLIPTKIVLNQSFKDGKGAKINKLDLYHSLINEVKKVNGTLTTVFHNYTFSSEERWNGFKELFTIILNSPDEN